MNQKLASEKVVVSSPLSFSGSAQRIWKITNVENPIAKAVLAILAITLITCAWMVVLCWYFVMYVLFGVFFFIFRLFTRSRRKNKRDKLRHRETLDAINERRQL
jgi:Flp pilus assembly protein TadB